MRQDIGALQQELEEEASDGEWWAVVRAGLARIPTDPELAWERLREVTVASSGTVSAYWAWLGMADISLKWGMHGQARNNIEQALRIADDSLPAVARLGLLALDEGNEEQGVELLGEIASTELGRMVSPRGVVALARVQVGRGRGEDAAVLLDSILEHYPYRVAALDLRASIAREEGNIEEAEVHLSRAVEAAPTVPNLAERLAEIREELDDLPGALDARRITAVKRADDTEAWRKMADVARAAEDASAEEEALKAVIRLDEDADAYRRMARLRTESEDKEGAKEAWSRLLDLDDDPMARIARARLYLEANDPRMAIGDLRRALEVEGEGEDDSETKTHPDIGDEASSLLETVSSMVGLPSQPVSGRTPDGVYRSISRVVERAYRKRLEDVPALGGTYSVRVIVSGHSVIDAEIVDNSLGDPKLEALIYWTIHDARFPHVDSPTEYTLPYTLSR